MPRDSHSKKPRTRDRVSPAISRRKAPSQERSKELVASILEAAIRVLVRDGGQQFSTVRVAEAAGVSVGSLYQYFPNKEALLFRLQTDEWKDTWSLIEETLCDPSRAPFDRLRRAVVLFFHSEREEAALRRALDDTGVLFRDAPEAHAHVGAALDTMRAFLADAVPQIVEARRNFLAEFVMTSMSSLAESITTKSRARREIEMWAQATADMYESYIRSL